MLRLRRTLSLQNATALQAALKQNGINPFISAKAISTSRLRCTEKFETVLPVSEIPGPVKVPFIGSVLKIYRAGGRHKFNQAVMTLQKEYGKIFQLKIGPERMVFISDPNMIEDVYRNEGKYPRREKSFPAWDNYHKKHKLPIGVFLE